MLPPLMLLPMNKSLAQERTITPNGDTILTMKRISPIRFGAFAGGIVGADIGAVGFAGDVNNTTLLSNYVGIGMGGLRGISAGAEGMVDISSLLCGGAKLGFSDRIGQFVFYPERGSALYDNGYQRLQTLVQMQSVQAEIALHYLLGNNVTLYGGINALFPTAMQLTTQFSKDTLRNTINDQIARRSLTIANLPIGFHCGATARWNLRETTTAQFSLMPFLDVHWQPAIALVSESGNTPILHQWSAVTVRLGISFCMNPILTDTLEIHPLQQRKDTAESAPQRPRIVEATQLPRPNSNDSILVEQVFSYSGIAREDTEILPAIKDFLKEIQSDIITKTRFRLILTTPPDERSTAEHRLKGIESYLLTQGIPKERIESSIVEKVLLQAVQRLRMQVLR